VIITINTPILRDVLHIITQNSLTVNLEKTETALTVSSTSTNELSHVSVVFRRPFFEKWDRAKGFFEVDAKTLHDLSNTIHKESAVKIVMYKSRICFEITDKIFKKITLSDLKTCSTLKSIKKQGTDKRLALKSETFLNIMGELGDVLDEAQLSLRKGHNQIFFSGRKMGLTVEMSPEYAGDFSFEDDICLEFPIKFFQRFLPLLGNFEEVVLRLGTKETMIIEASNDKWRLALIVPKIEKNRNLP